MGSFVTAIAVFDLDGTITRHDTFVPYLRGWLRRHPARRRRLALAAAAIRYLATGRDRGRLKSDLLRACMGGAGRAEIDAWSDAFVAGLDAASLCAGALAAIASHRADGDRLVLLSASVDLYVPRIGRRLGFDETICTGVAWRDGQLDGGLTTANRRGDEKRRCIDALRQRFAGAKITAYGNSSSDLPHLVAVDRPVLVNGGRRAIRAAERLGVRVEDWRNN
ncbi:MAG: HAD-IB family hydrolase [Steroidobacteraceae bacterium]